ncbi:MAG: YceI family protein [Bacteroidales bacterium]|nr:YceI family protein [Bacteroidales bacterium]
MNKKSIIFVIASLIAYSGLSLQAQTASFKKLAINTTDSRVNWLGKKPTGEHTGYVKLTGGEVIIDKNEIIGGSFTIDFNSIVNLDLKDEGMNNRLVGHLKSADFFDVAKYPTGRFSITKVTKVSGPAAGAAKATHRIEGDLTMKGITKKISFDASINLLNGKLVATTPSFTIDRTQWGVNYQSKSIFAELKDQFIYDDMTLAIDLYSN